MDPMDPNNNLNTQIVLSKAANPGYPGRPIVIALVRSS